MALLEQQATIKFLEKPSVVFILLMHSHNIVKNARMYCEILL